MNVSFARALDSAAVPYVKDFYQGGYHGWPYWERELHWPLPLIMSLIGPSATSCRSRLPSSGSAASAGRHSIRGPACS
jgi:hypothetical protein